MRLLTLLPFIGLFFVPLHNPFIYLQELIPGAGAKVFTFTISMHKRAKQNG